MWIKSISEYLNILEEPADVYRSYPLMKSGFVFRGMEDHSYKLLPGVYREVIDDVDGMNINNSKYLAFVDEKSILHEFLQDAAAYVPQLDIHEYVRWIELAQHHGVPTRFLDWTENPLVALYFAWIKKAAGSAGGPEILPPVCHITGTNLAACTDLLQ